MSAADAASFFRSVLESGSWEPFEGDDLPEQTHHGSGGYRDAARTTRTITLRPPKRSLLLTVGFLMILPLWISFAIRHGLDDWLAWLQVCVGVPPTLFGIVQLYRFLRPARIEVDSRRATTRGGETIGRDEVRFVDVARHTDATVRGVLPKRWVGLFLGGYKENVWVLYAQRSDGSVVILGDHLDEKVARAAALRLEQALELGERAQVEARVEELVEDETTTSADERTEHSETL